MRRGASWTADHHLQLTVAAVAGSVLVVLAAELSWLAGRPDGGCPVERPAGIQRSGVVAVVGKARTPAMASVAGRCPACGVHHPVPSSGVRRSSPPVSTRPVSSPSGCPAVRCPPVRWSAGGCPPPSVRTRPSHPTSGGGVVDQVGAAGNLHHRNGSSPGGRHAVERLGQRPSRPGRGRGCRGRALVSGGRWRTRAGLGAGGGRA